MAGEKKTYFFDSHGALWEALNGDEPHNESAALGPTGMARGVNARLFYDILPGETDYAAAKRHDLVGEMDPHDGWAYLDIPDEGPIDLKLKGGKDEEEMISIPKSLLQRAANSLHDAYDGGEWFAAMPENVPWAAAKEATEGLEVRDEIRALLK